MKISKALLILFVLIAISFLGYFIIINNYPNSWDSVKIGDKRDTVNQKIGQPTDEFWEVKWDLWTKSHPFGWYCYQINYTPDTTVASYHIYAFFGNREKKFTRTVIKSESLKTY